MGGLGNSYFEYSGYAVEPDENARGAPKRRADAGKGGIEVRHAIGGLIAQAPRPGKGAWGDHTVQRGIGGGWRGTVARGPGVGGNHHAVHSAGGGSGPHGGRTERHL